MNRRRHHIALALLLALALVGMSGCDALEQALRKMNDDYASTQLDTPVSSSGDIDWGFVPVVREMAQETFMAGFPEASITETGVACKTASSDRVIVTITYSMNGKTGTYGFDYEKNEQGEYELVRYGDGVSSDDL